MIPSRICRIRGIRHIVVALIAATPMQLLACEVQPVADRCHAISATNKLMVAFPAVESDLTWRWHREDTPRDHMEYEWQVQLGHCDAKRGFQSNGLAFGVQLFKGEGRDEAKGSLADMLNIAQTAVAQRRVSANQVRYSVLPAMQLIAGERSGRVYVGASDSATVATLLKTRPGFAKLVYRTPEDDEGMTCVTALKYE